MTNKSTITWDKYIHNSPNKTENYDEEENDRVVNTPFGIFRVDDSMNPFKQFNFWIANTNFKLTQQTKKILDEADGVEALIFLTKYRFIVGIGKLFNEKFVKENIEKLLTKSSKYNLFINQELNDKLFLLQERLNVKKYWIIYSFPNGNLDYLFSDTISDELINKFKFYKEAQNYSRGHIILSPELNRQMKINEEKNN